MIKRIIIWALVIILAYFLFSAIAKSCKNNTETTADVIEDTTEDVIDKTKEIATFEDDDVNIKKGYAVHDEDDRIATSASESTDDSKEVEDFRDDDDVSMAAEARHKKEAAKAAAERTLRNQENTSTTSEHTEATDDDIDENYKKYLVVAGSYKQKSNAEAMVAKLRKMGHPDAELFTFDFAEYYSVTAGRYTSRSEAANIASSLQSKGVDCYTHKMRSKYFE